MAFKQNKKQKMSLVSKLLTAFGQEPELQLKGRIVYFSDKFRKVLFVPEQDNWLNTPEIDLDVKQQHPLLWKKELEQEGFTHCFSYYEKEGEDRVTLAIKVPPAQVKKIQPLMDEKQAVQLTVQLKTYVDYPTPGKSGLWVKFVKGELA